MPSIIFKNGSNYQLPGYNNKSQMKSRGGSRRAADRFVQLLAEVTKSDALYCTDCANFYPMFNETCWRPTGYAGPAIELRLLDPDCGFRCKHWTPRSRWIKLLHWWRSLWH